MQAARKVSRLSLLRIVPCKGALRWDGRVFSRSMHSSPDQNSSSKGSIVEGSVVLNDCGQTAFYNKNQTINRDLSIQVITEFSENIIAERTARYRNIAQNGEHNQSDQTSTCEEMDKITILDAFAATGVRSLRYIKEIPNVKHVYSNDLSMSAFMEIVKNTKENNVSESDITVSNVDASFAMHSLKHNKKRIDVIDIDPYGASAPFLDAAVQAIASDGGLLCITSTDTAVLCGTKPEKALAAYGSLTFTSPYKNEMALRTLLNAVDSVANRYNRFIVPQLSVCIDFYVRVFVRVYKSTQAIQNTPLRRLMLYQSNQCPTFETHKLGYLHKTNLSEDSHTDPGKCRTVMRLTPLPLDKTCSVSGGKWKIGGPFWAGRLHRKILVDKILKVVEATRLAQGGRYLIIPEKFKNGENGIGTRLLPESQQNDSSEIKKKNNKFKFEAEELMPFASKHAIPTAERLSGLLKSVSEELEDVPFFYSLAHLASALHCVMPPQILVKSALKHAGYMVSNFHGEPNAIKTDAPNEVVWDVMRAYCKDVSPDNFTSSTLPPVTQRILAQPSTHTVNFAPIPKLKKGLWIAKNPRHPDKNWGPKKRSTIQISSAFDDL